jgi:hypothetical protein
MCLSVLVAFSLGDQGLPPPARPFPEWPQVAFQGAALSLQRVHFGHLLAV